MSTTTYARETFSWYSGLVVASPLAAPIVVGTTEQGVELVLDYKITDYTTNAVSFAYGESNAQIVGNALALIAEKSGKQYFRISSDDGIINWAPRFETRREAQDWLEGDHDWDSRVEVEFEGDTAVSLCSNCQGYSMVDNMAGIHRLAPIWLCMYCQ